MPISPKFQNRFFIDEVQVDPIYPQEASKKYERADKRVIYRESLNGTLTFLRGDFKKVINQDLDHEFALRIDRANGLTYQERYIEGNFFKTDCTFDEDKRISEVKATAVDRYEKLITSVDKQFDLIHDLEPPLHTVKYVKQPLLQIAFWGHQNLVNINGDSVTLKEIPPLTGPELEAFGFRGDTVDGGIINEPRIGFIPGEGDMTVDVSGYYEVTGLFWVRTDGNFRISEEDIGGGDEQWVIRGINDFASLGAVYRVSTLNVSLFEEDTQPADRLMGGSRTFQSTTTDSQCRFFITASYNRLLTDEDTVGGDATLPLPAEGEDIGGHHFGYQNYVAPTNDDLLEYVVFSADNHTTTPTQYGKFADIALHFAGEYFDKFTLLGLDLKPVNQIAWSEYSLWGLLKPAMQALIDEAVTVLTCRNAYELGDVIKYMLERVDPAITWNSEAFHSQFLYNTNNPLTGVAYALTHFVTAKSNITEGDYDNPATRGVITFNDIEQLLLAANLYWWIDKNNNFHVEHIHYFNNGRSYNTQIISNDLTVQTDPRTQLPWAYHTKKYRYKKEVMPERIEFSWMDSVSEIFKGYPIEMISRFVQKGNIENVSVSNFTSDLDFGLAFPDNFSRDGFFILAATFADNEYTVQFDELNVTGIPATKIQNGFWSYPFLHDKFHRHNLPANHLKINQVKTVATTTKRAKEQEIIYPSPIEPDAMRLLRTSLGVAEIESLEVNLTTREAKIKVLLPLDFDNPMFQ